MTIDPTQIMNDPTGAKTVAAAKAVRDGVQSNSALNKLLANQTADERRLVATTGKKQDEIMARINRRQEKIDIAQGLAVSTTPAVTSAVTSAADIGDGSKVPKTSDITSPVVNPNDVNNNGIPDNLEAAQLQITGMQAAAAEARRLQLEDAATKGKAAIDLLKETIKQYFTLAGDDKFVDELSAIIDGYAKDGFDSSTISVMLPQTAPYKVRFSGNETRIKAGLSALKPSDYLSAEESYNEILKRYNLGDLAKRDTFSSLIGGQVSADELADRVVNVYDRIRNADTALRAELDRVEGLDGNITDADFARALLTGEAGAAQLKRKISTAEITAEARIRKLNVGSAEQLQQLGVTREQARTGFEQIALTQPRLTQLSEIYTKETPEATGLQKELEAEQFQGMQSQRRRQLAEQETTAFMGQSGTASGISLGRRRSGSY